MFSSSKTCSRSTEMREFTIVHTKEASCLSHQYVSDKVCPEVSYEQQQRSVLELEVCKYADVDPAIIRPGVPDCGVTNATCRVKLFIKAGSWVPVREGGCTMMTMFLLDA